MSAKLLQYKLFGFIFCLFIVLNLQAQMQLRYNISAADSALLAPLRLKTNFSDSTQALSYLKSLQKNMILKGYVTCSVDSLYTEGADIHVNLYVGNQYKWDRIAASPEFSRAVNDFLVSGSNDAQILLENVYKALSEKGYPSAEVYLDSITISGRFVSARLQSDRKGFTVVDSIRVIGTKSVSVRYLQQYLHIQKGTPYQKKMLADIDDRLYRLPFLEPVQSTRAEFFQTGVVLNVFIRSKPNNRFNALVGLLQQGNGTKVKLSGEAELWLQNSFGGGEVFQFTWRQPASKSSLVRFGYDQPYFARTSFGGDFNFELFKKDSAFVNSNISIGVSKQNKYGSIALTFRRFSGAINYTDTNFLKINKRLPEEADMGVTSLGLSFKTDTRNSASFPSEGWLMKIAAEYGRKDIRKNNTISSFTSNGFEFSRLYDTVHLKSYQLRLEADAEKFFLLSKAGVVKTAINGAAMFSDKYYKNELYRLGGLRMLRGFDEQSIYALRYAMLTIEYRYMMNTVSYFYTFTDLAEVQRTRFNMYASAGIGMNLQSKSGVLNICYAVGKAPGESFNFRTAKIHIGLSALF